METPNVSAPLAPFDMTSTRRLLELMAEDQALDSPATLPGRELAALVARIDDLEQQRDKLLNVRRDLTAEAVRLREQNRTQQNEISLERMRANTAERIIAKVDALGREAEAGVGVVGSKALRAALGGAA